MPSCKECGNEVPGALKEKKGRAPLAIVSDAIAVVIVVAVAVVLIGAFGCNAAPVPDADTSVSGTEDEDAVDATSVADATNAADATSATNEDKVVVDEAKDAVSLEQASVGDIVHLGELSFMAYDAGKELQQSDDYAWLVLAVEDNRVLLITEAVIDKRPYNAEHVDITWENCTIRQWLNNEFFACLPSSVKDRIVETDLANDDNTEFGVPGGNTTKDRVFLLSIDEAKRYFSSDEQRQAPLQVRGDSESRGAWRWWLRSPGNSAASAALIGGPILMDDRGGTERYSDGSLFSEGNGVNRSNGLRPAFWIER
jgi:hypothetical protein